ncbi:MAG TPA: thiolase domain-containing protein [Anaerolineales bacterium]|nr:thiolase domain-containing protein [Anaerolineales bacterium]
MEHNMSEIVIAGIGQTEVGEHWNISLRDLALDAIQHALEDAGGLRPQALFVGNMLGPNLSNQAHLGVLLADHAGLLGIEAATLEAAGASGGAALRQGYLAVASRLVDVALVVGVEKFTDKIGADVDSALATTSDSDFEAVQGLTSTAQAALLMRRYMHDHDVPDDGFEGFALVAHANAAGNPYAMFRKAIKREAYTGAEVVNEPLNMFDIAPNADGAAAVVITRGELIPLPGRYPRVRIAGSASSADTLALHDRHDMLNFEAARTSTQKAMRQVGAALDQIDFFEYHDAYGIYAALSLEAAGFAERGQGWRLAADGSIARGGKFPCATMGGLKARGFPGGATGVYQAVEATLQLRCEAGANQVHGARLGLVQSMGGPGSTVVSHVLQALD